MRLLRNTVVCLVAMLALTLSGGEGPKFQSQALIVAGECGEECFAENYKDWISRLHKVLTQNCAIPAGNVTVLAEKKEWASCVNDISNKGSVIKALNTAREKLKPGDQFVLFYIGHGTAQNKNGKLCLPGADISAQETVDWLNRINTREIIFVNAAANSDSFVDKCSQVGRTVITAVNNPGEGNATYFLEFFLKAYEGKGADANNNGSLELLEVFNFAASECPKWYLRQYFVEAGPSWRVEGKQSRQLWQKFYGKIPEKQLAAALQPDAEDAEPQLGEWGPQWDSRRMPTEHAQLDDNGDRLGTAVFVDNQFMSIVGTEEGADGWYARSVVIGKPQGKTEPPPAPEKP